MEPLSGPRKTVTATFRVSEQVYLRMQEEARSQDISLNTLVSHLFDTYVNEGIYLTKVGYVIVTKPTFRQILEASTDAAIVQASGSSGRETWRTLTLARGGMVTKETLLRSLRMFAEFGGFAHYSEIETPKKHVIVLMHDLGQKGSLFISNLTKAMFEEINQQPKISTGERSVVIEF